MTRQVLLMRGINVGGTGKVPMAELREMLGELGCEGVETYIQSGNAVFESDEAPEALGARIEDAVETRYGFRRDALVIPGAAFIEIAASYPFPEGREAPKTGHVWFLTRQAADGAQDRLAALAAEGERFELEEIHALYLHAPDGIGRSALAAKAEKALGVPATARNLNTVQTLVKMLAGPGEG